MTLFRILVVAIFIFIAPHSTKADTDRFLDIREITSPGGVTAWLVTDKSVPVIAMSFAFAGSGAVNEPDRLQGLAQLLSNTLDEGAGERDSQAFQKTLADNSISLRFAAGRDNFTGSLRTLTRHSDLAFNLLRDSLTSPRFDAEPVQRMKDANISRIRTSMSDPEWIAARVMNDIIFEGHPYARNSGGTITSLKAITAQDLRDFMKSYLTRDRLRIAVAGDIDPESLGVILDRVFGTLPVRAVQAIDTTPFTPRNAQTIALVERDIPQTIIAMSHAGIDRNDPDWHAAQVMNFILGGAGFGSRLMTEIREKRGLTYGVYTSFSDFDLSPLYGVETSTRNETAAEVISLIRADWDRMRKEGASEEELRNAISYLTGSMPLSLTSTGSIAGILLSLQLDNLPSTYLDTLDQKISAVTADDVKRAANRILTPDAFVTVLVGKPDKITPTRKIETLPNVE